MPNKIEVNSEGSLYYYQPTKFWLWFWVVFDFLMFIQPLIVRTTHRLGLFLEMSLGFFFLFVSIIQFLFYYSVEFTEEGICFHFLYKKTFYNWNKLKRIKTYRGRNVKYLYFKVETATGEIYNFYLPRRDSETIYQILRKYSN